MTSEQRGGERPSHTQDSAYADDRGIDTDLPVHMISTHPRGIDARTMDSVMDSHGDDRCYIDRDNFQKKVTD